jgi:hypothetical protein
MSNNNTKHFPKFRKGKGGSRILGFRNSRFRGFKCQKTAQNISRSSEKVKVGPVFRDFRIRGFGFSNVNNNTKHFLKFRKGEGGTRNFRISEFGVSGFEMSTTTQNIS